VPKPVPATRRFVRAAFRGLPERRELSTEKKNAMWSNSGEESAQKEKAPEEITPKAFSTFKSVLFLYFDLM